MAKIKTFPQVIFVTVEEDRNDEEWLSAHLTKRDALSDNGRQIVGTYQFVAAEEVTEATPIARKRKTRAVR